MKAFRTPRTRQEILASITARESGIRVRGNRTRKVLPNSWSDLKRSRRGRND